MSEPKAPLPPRYGCLVYGFLIGLCLALSLTLAIGPATAVGVQRRLIPPVSFAINLGRLEIIAPCPRYIYCDESTPFYGVYWGAREPDGSTRYRSLFFMYREPVKRGSR